MIPILAFFSAVVFIAYIALVIAAVVFANAQTTLSAEVRDRQTRISALEMQYYGDISRISDTNVASLGYRAPVKAQYVEAVGSPAVSLAPTGAVAR
jgi:hypothetical protein